MNALRIFGILLIVLGLISLIYQGITYTSEEALVEMGPVAISARENKTIPLPPLLGGLMLAGGVALLMFGARGRRES
jgi:hypothetical protein